MVMPHPSIRAAAWPVCPARSWRPTLATVASFLVASMGWTAVARAQDSFVALQQTPDARSGSLQALLLNSPPAATPWASSLIQAVEAFTAIQEHQKQLRQLRMETDAVKTELVAINSALELVGRERVELDKQVAALDAKRRDSLGALRKELEGRLNEELTTARSQIVRELDTDMAKQVHAFEARQGEAIEESLTQELQSEEREILHVTKELEALTQELRERLGQLQPGSELANSVQTSVGRTLAQRNAELQARRADLKIRRDKMLADRRAELTERIRQRNTQELQTRLMYKEATLRQSMADLLSKAQAREQDDLVAKQQALMEVKGRQGQLGKRQQLLATRLEEMERKTIGLAKLMEQDENTHAQLLGKLEQTFQQANPRMHQEGLSWFGQVIQQSPPEMAAELSIVYNRLMAKAQQEQQAAEHEKMIRERQLAMEVSREMERRFQQDQQERERTQAAVAKKVDDLMAKIRALQSAGKFDDALRLVAQIQAIDPEQSNQAEMLRQDIISARSDASQREQSAGVERMFGQAMQAFQKGNYEQAVALFERVISSEAAQPGAQ